MATQAPKQPNKKVKKFRDMDVPALQNTLVELQKESFNLKFQNTLSKLENVSLIKQKRRDIARVKTLIRENEIKGQAKA